ncbi:MAG: hypothetical protein HYU87_00320 [Chloroflexi bacterium]|nr:hypothetical protein [Chloroflexota bacterium]
MEARVILTGLPGRIRPLVPAHLRGFRAGAQWSYLMKLYYGNQQLHYEASHRPRLRTIEIGLHFEADDLTNARLLGAFRTHERAVRRKLPAARFEEWDRGWARVWEAVAYDTLDAALRDDLARRLALYIATLEPILREELPADVPWSL